jgi:hypothetical protein
MNKITPEHLARGAYVYVRQSTADQLRIPMMSAGHSNRCRPPIPIDVGRPFRLMSAGVAGRPAGRL